jgi:glycosyltransferase involved in cell wall biosynthesis
VVHVQYGTDVFGLDDRLPRLCGTLVRMGIPSAVTLHTVLPRATAIAVLGWNAGRFYRALAATARIVVHQKAGQRDVLEGWGVPRAATAVIPHGTPAAPAIDRESARRRLAIPATAQLLLCLGFLHPLKNVHVAVAAVSRLIARRPDVRLVIAGCVRGDAFLDRQYARWLRGFIARRGLDRHVHLREEFLTDDAMDDLLAAADVLLLPYWEPYGSASGIVHLAFAATTPMLCSRSVKFAEVAEASGEDVCVPGHRPRAWAGRIDAWLARPATLAAVRAGLARRAAETRWPVVAADTVALYRALAAPDRRVGLPPVSDAPARRSPLRSGGADGYGAPGEDGSHA